MSVNDRSDISTADVTLTDDGNYLLNWKGTLKGTQTCIFYGLSPEKIDRTTAKAVVLNKEEALATGLDPDFRYYFEISLAGRPGIITATRRVMLEGAYNCRDMGGYETVDGRRVKWGRLFRSDALSRLTDRDRLLIKRMGLKSAIDFRSRAEAEKAPDLLPEDSKIKYLHFPIQTGEMNFVTAMERLKDGDSDWLTEDYMIRGYLKNIDHYPDVWGKSVNRMAEEDAFPLLFHCTGGKDRAGTFAALILAVLGVPEETIIYDHQLSNRYIADLMPTINRRLSKYGVDPEKMKPYFTAPIEGVAAVLERIRRKYKTVENYLTTKGTVSGEVLDILRKRLL